MAIPDIASFDPSDFQKETGVSPETLQKFSRYARMIEEWNERASLIGPGTLNQIWHRHFLDSAQLVPLLPKHQPGRMADVGSGAGFPGFVLALMGVQNITLFERNTRKCAFLQAAATELKIPVEILNLTSEEHPGEPFDVITARATAELSDLLFMTRKLRKPTTICLFLKGKNLDAEIREAQKDWQMPDLRRITSITEPEAAILRLTTVSPAR